MCFATQAESLMQNRPSPLQKPHVEFNLSYCNHLSYKSNRPWHSHCRGVGPDGPSRSTNHHKETTMKLTRVILLALAFAIPFASTTIASRIVAMSFCEPRS